MVIFHSFVKLPEGIGHILFETILADSDFDVRSSPQGESVFFHQKNGVYLKMRTLCNMAGNVDSHICSFDSNLLTGWW